VGLAACVLAASAAIVHPLAGSTPHIAAAGSPSAAGAVQSTSPPAAAPPGALVFGDNFGNPGSGWAPDPGQAGVGSAAYGADGFHMVALQPQNVLNTFSVASPYAAQVGSLSVLADGVLSARAPADGWGVRCDQGGRTGLRYTFEIHGDGSWVIFKIDNGGAAVLAQGGSQAVRTGGVPNRVRGDCTELPNGATRLTMWVNDVQVGQATDAHPGAPTWHAALVLYRDRASQAAGVRIVGVREYDLGRRS